MEMQLKITGYVYEGTEVLGHQEITISLPDTDDLDAAHLVLGEGQQNWGKIGEQVAIMAVWDGGRKLQARINEREDAIHNAVEPEVADKDYEVVDD